MRNPKIIVNMLGGLTVMVQGKPLLEESGKINKPWQVLCYLVLNRAAPVPPAKLLGALWPEENLTDPNNVLKNTVYALRREFKQCVGEAAKPVLFQDGGYICNPEVEFMVDVEHFEACCRAAAQHNDEEAKVGLLREATALYKGDLAHSLAEEGWAMPRALYLQKLYTESVDTLCEILYKMGRYSELLAEATAANKIDPMRESFYLHVLRALFELGMYRVIVPIYQKTARLFDAEKGQSLGGELREIYAAASERVNPIEQDILSIRDDLRDVRYEGAPTGGPLYCTYDVFKYLYQMVLRSAERSGARILIILVSLQEADGGQPREALLDEAMQRVRDELLGGLLRKSDTVARYSKSQYILMLASDQPSGAEPVVRRIRKSIGNELAERGLRIVFATTEMDPLAEMP